MAGLGLSPGSPSGLGLALLERALRATAGGSTASAAASTTTVATLATGTSPGSSYRFLASSCDGATASRLTPITARIASPPRPAFRAGGVLELHVLARKDAKKRRPRPGRGGGGDDQWGGGGGGGGGGDDSWDGGNWDPEPDPAGADLAVLWNLLCFFSLLQSFYFVACQTFNPGRSQSCLRLTNALFGGATAGRRPKLTSACA